MGSPSMLRKSSSPAALPLSMLSSKVLIPNLQRLFLALLSAHRLPFRHHAGPRQAHLLLVMSQSWLTTPTGTQQLPTGAV